MQDSGARLWRHIVRPK